MTPLRASLAILALLWSGTALAKDYKVGAIEIHEPWARATPRSAPGGAAYVTLRNTGTTPDRLVSARSPLSGLVQVHEMKMDGNVMQMRELEKGLEIPAGATVTLAPGGYHLMMMGLKDQVDKGTTVPMTLTFEKAGSINIEFTVEGMGATKPGEK
jgi:periplasmic copper chaperone A